jgi:ribosomal protein L25 (general stress protein Ctc)
MAKKKSINYNPNTALIQGAAAAYRNYDNVAGMYQGLEKVTQAGANLVTSVIDKKNKEVEKRNKINKLFDDAADKVLLESGALGQSLYDSTYDELVEAKKTYLEGIDQNDDKKRIEGLKFIQNHSAWVQSHKAFNLEFAKDYKEGLMTSDYTDEEKSIMTKIQTSDYKKTSRNEQGDVVFHLDIDGEEKLVSSKEYEKLASIFKNVKVSKAHMAGKTFTLTKEIFDAEGYLAKLVEDLPANEEEWRGMVGDDVAGRKGGKQSLKSLLEQDMADGTLEAEIINALGIDITKFDTEDPPGLSDDEKANFIDAVVNTKNDNFDLEISNQILKERLLRVAEEDHTAHWQKINNEKQRKEALIRNQNVEKTPSQYGYRTQEMMKKEYDAIKSGEIGDEITVKIDGVNYTFTRMNDGNFEHIGANNKSTIKTPNQIADLRELIGFDRIPDPKGKNPFTMTTNFPVKSKEK